MSSASLSEPCGVANLRAILADQPYQNSALSVFEINLILANEGGFMPDEAVAWFRSSRGTFGISALEQERERCAKIAAARPHHSGLEIAELIREGGEWIDQNYQIDRYGVALMMIREGCADPAGLARRILSEFEASRDAVGPSSERGR